MKTQTIRLIDVFVIGPWMIVAAKELARNKNPALAAGLLFFGVATVIYNGQNYLKRH